MKRTFVLTTAVVVLAAVVPLGMFIETQIKASAFPQKAPETQAGDYILSGPYTHKNLTIFLVHGKDLMKGKTPLTLQEALAQKKVVVYETKDVNELAIENRSNEDVYVQSGDIVKGGQQDRMLAVDLIVPPHSGKLPIAAFCVESGRWTRRGSEQAASFSSSENVAATKEIKLAAKRSNSQGDVWKNVSVAQDKLSENVGARVNSTVSSSSLELAVENRQVQQNTESYMKALSGIVNRSEDVIGYVFAINGAINSADVYASSGLFKKLWPKLLKANAIEAIAELQRDKKLDPTTAGHVKAFLAEVPKSSAAEKEVTARIRLFTTEDEKNIFFETRDRAQKGAWIHRNYIRK
jgi:hypothetical protein